ncbi:MAG: OmpA family protein [Carboxylicivirga sp.]|nr:OmpA family protein [Carboxylicivirga sp.]
MKSILFLAGFTLLISACVPLKQFEELSEENNQLENKANELSKDNDALKVQNRELSADLDRFKSKVDQLQEDLKNLTQQKERLQQRYDDLNQNYSQALEGLKNKRGSSVDNKRLLEYLQKLQEDLQKREDELALAEQAINEKKRSLELAQQELDQAQAQLNEQNKRLVELEQMLKAKDEAMHALKKTISDALTGFSGDELQVHMKDGKVYVSLEEKLLFQSGKYEVNQQGKSALVKIATVLEQNPDIDILVEGHTDNVPYRGSGVLKDNWDLSVKRATTVVRILIDNSKIVPSRITAAGRSKYIPVVEGNTSAALQKNRRTEIILAPNWNEVLKLIN